MLRIRGERQRRGWTLTHLSALTGIAESDLSQVERGLRPAFPGWQRRIARAFGQSVADLFGGGVVADAGNGPR